VLQLSQGKILGVYHSKGKTRETAFRNLPFYVREILQRGDYRIEPFPKRLYVQAHHNLAFEVPGTKGENRYDVEVHEQFRGIGFSYQPIFEVAAEVECIASVPVVRKVAAIASNILRDLELQLKALVIGIKESPGIGNLGYEGRCIVGTSRVVYIELELFSFPLHDVNYWEGILWHEAMHAKYILDGRWPSIWPFYNTDAGPLWVLDCLLHFSIDGWIEQNSKPTVYWPPPEEPDADFKSTRLYELRKGLQDSSCQITEDFLTKVADDLWGQETDIWQVWKIMQELGLTVPEGTPLGKYLREYKTRSPK
jgi:hypothetical protein